jgi:hypothetical protein
MDIRTKLYDLASQENCDGEPYDTMQDAADYITQLEQELETERMRLAACGAVALANTPDSAKDARKMQEEYRSASLDDVIRAVDSEMGLRRECDELKAHCEGFRSLYDRFGNDGFEDVQLIEEFGNVACSVPIQSLAEIKAQAIEDAAKKFEGSADGCCPADIFSSDLYEYANKLRESV